MARARVTYGVVMRYRIGTDPESAPNPDAGIFAGVALFGLALGMGFVVAGVRGRHPWLAVWGGGLALASAAYLVAMALGHG